MVTEGKKVVFFEVEPWEEEYFRDHLSQKEGTQLVFHQERLTPQNVQLAEEADFITCFIYSNLKAPILEQLHSLKGIATMSVGANHVDLSVAREKNIIVSNVPAYGPNTVAEHAMALLLCLSRNIVPSVERTKEGDFDFHGMVGWDLMGKTLGIIGTGKIGAHVARIANGLGMRIVASDPKPNEELIEKFGVEYVTLPQLYSASDVITLHCPLMGANEHLIGREQFKQMKRGVVIINTARGGLIDTRALIEALDDGIVKQAGIDVLEDEDLLLEEKEFFSPYFQLKDYQTALADHMLMRHPKVLVTPHNAFNSKEALKNILKTTFENLEGMMHSDPVNLVH